MGIFIPMAASGGFVDFSYDESFQKQILLIDPFYGQTFVLTADIMMTFENYIC